ncbi:hypothetical protein ABEB36_009396 [Hypothenemus hampei]|uniref:Uncharacterized protein n=1 Tax=Hypothenemus hampei TaxID=57062 RepID=A0ABD1EG98_HYPHA
MGRQYRVIKTENTYAWIIDTADSNTRSRIWAIISKFNVKELSNLPDCPIRVRRRWPAIIFAVSRIASVPGRMQFLIVSTITRKGSNGHGAPCGTRCANILIVLFVHPKIINPNHIGSLSLSVNTICLDARDGITQNEGGIKIKKIIDLSQFNDNLTS